jgi:gas vesicle protein
MNNFIRGLLFGAGIGLLVAPMKGEELRKRLSERANDFRRYLPENTQIDAYRHQIGERVSQTTDTLKNYAQQAGSRASVLGNKAQERASTFKERAQTTASTLGDKVQSRVSRIGTKGQEGTDLL